MKFRGSPLGVAGLLLLALLFCAPVALGSGAADLIATNVVSQADGAFFTSGTIGLGILTFLVGLGAVMMGWRVARGRGK